MRSLARLALFLLLLVGVADTASAQIAPQQPQRPFGQLTDLWTRQLDRIATRTEQAGLLPVEIDTLREQATASHELANQVEKIVQMVEENSAAVGQVATSAHDLNNMADALVQSVARFRLG